MPIPKKNKNGCCLENYDCNFALNVKAGVVLQQEEEEKGKKWELFYLKDASY